MSVIEEIDLPNGLKLVITDLSRRIAADTQKIELAARMKVNVSESFFSSQEDYQTILRFFGKELTYEHKMERTFVTDSEETVVRTELLVTFKVNTLSYLSSPNFAKKMALSTLRDIKLNPFKYQHKASEPETDE
jgi:hypothetical protein